MRGIATASAQAVVEFVFILCGKNDFWKEWSEAGCACVCGVNTRLFELRCEAILFLAGSELACGGGEGEDENEQGGEAGAFQGGAVQCRKF